MKQHQNATPALPGANKKRNVIIIFSVLALAVAILLIFFLPLLFKQAKDDAIIRIPVNATSENVKDSISRYLGDDYAALVMRMAKINRTDFSNRHGAYLIPAGTSPIRAERKLSKGAQQPLTITINGFRSITSLSDRVARRLDFSADSLLETATGKEILNKYGLTPQQALALFIDDSYEVYWSASPETLVKKIGDNYNKVWNAERLRKASELGLTPAEVMTVCSIVDEESNKLDEKGKIGRLYINRVKKGMPLQADPTIRFALDDFTIRRVKGNHLKVDSPFNTYKNKGLPPGPIRTTSVATIDAVLDSQPSTHLYMCAKEDFSGYHNFASSYSEHQANARRYQKALDNRGIK